MLEWSDTLGRAASALAVAEETRMTWIANLLVGRPLASVLLALAFLMLHVWRRSFRTRASVAPLVAAGAWTTYGAW